MSIDCDSIVECGMMAQNSGLLCSKKKIINYL